MHNDDFTIEELEAQHGAELPGRHLMTSLSIGVGLLGVGTELYVGTDPLELFVGVYV